MSNEETNLSITAVNTQQHSSSSRQQHSASSSRRTHSSGSDSDNTLSDFDFVESQQHHTQASYSDTLTLANLEIHSPAISEGNTQEPARTGAALELQQVAINKAVHYIKNANIHGIASVATFVELMRWVDMQPTRTLRVTQATDKHR